MFSLANVDRKQLVEIADRGRRAVARMHNLHEKAQEQMGEMIAALEVSASSFAFGFARGYFAKPGQDVAIMGIPIDLAGGLLGHVAALFGDLGHYKRDAHNMANGALASYTTTLGLKLGVEQAQKHPPSGVLAQGYGGFTGYVGAGGPVTDDDVSRMVLAAQR
jgi:hypothetical protein